MVAAPAGYALVKEPRATIVARADLADAIVAALRGAPSTNPTLHGYASQFPGARPMQGRETAYALTLPSSVLSVVVRHNRHGGALRHLTGDLFAAPTRAPRELDIALRLASLGVPTPPVVAYAVYPAVLGLARSDVVTEEVAPSTDLGEVLLRHQAGPARQDAIAATARLLDQMAKECVRHHDLNVKNVLLRVTGGGAIEAYVLDVDRIEFSHSRFEASRANTARLMRSLAKWRLTKGATIEPAEIEALGAPHRRLVSATTSS